MKLQAWQKTQIAQHNLQTQVTAFFNRYVVFFFAVFVIGLLLQLVIFPSSILNYIDGAGSLSSLFLHFILCVALAVLPAYQLNKFYIKHLAKMEDNIKEEIIIRGEKLLPIEEYLKQEELTKKLEEEGHHLVVGDPVVPIPSKSETQHTIIMGKTGTGKTQTFLQEIDQVVHKYKCIIYDYKGDFVSRFYDQKTDHIFNPADPRCVQWCPLSEVENKHEYKLLATSLVPPQPQVKDPFWHESAQNTLVGIIQTLKQQGFETNAAFYDYANIRTAEEYQALLEPQYAQYVNPDATHATPGVLSEMRRHVNSLEYIQNLGSSFTISKWLEDKEPSTLFIVSNPVFEDSFKPLLNAFITLLIQKIISQEDQPDRRIFFFLDEIGTLNNIPSLVRGLTLGRSKGLAMFIGIQDTAQLRFNYADLAHTILANTGTTIAMSVADPDTAEYLSKRFGQAEVEEVVDSYSLSDEKENISINRQKRVKEVITSTEFLSLKTLQAFLKISGVPNCTKINIPVYKGGDRK